MHRALWFEGDNNAANEVREQWNRRTALTAALPHLGSGEAVVWVVDLEQPLGRIYCLTETVALHEADDDRSRVTPLYLHPAPPSAEVAWQVAFEAAAKIFDQMPDDKLWARQVASRLRECIKDFEGMVHLYPHLATLAAPPSSGLMEAAIAGWNACRKSVYAVCEDIQDRAANPAKISLAATDEQRTHEKGYYFGESQAAKSIARGFCAMEAIDDNHFREAVRALALDAAPEYGEVASSQQTPKWNPYFGEPGDSDDEA